MEDGRVSDVRLELRLAVERDALGLVRFACAALGYDARALALEVLGSACGMAETGDAEALSRPRLFAAIRKRCAQVRRASSESPGDGLRAALLRVRPSERDALVLRYVAGLSVSDVASACAVDEHTARARISRALAEVAPWPASDDAESSEVAARRGDVTEHLADIIDGIAPDRIADFVAEDDVSRDRVHDVEQAIQRLGTLEAAHSVDIDACTDAVVASLGPQSAPVSPPRRAAAGSPSPAAEGAPTPAAAPAAPAAPVPPTTSARRRLVGLGVVLAVLFGWYVVRRRADATRYSDDAWSGKVTDVARAFGDGSGVERCSPDRVVCSPTDRGDDVPAGSVLRTDASTRIAIMLRDGSRFVLDEDSELHLDGDQPRRARLDRGSLVVDIVRAGQSRARVDTPLGFVEMEAAKASISADSRRTAVEVVRGTLRLVDAAERGIGVHAGEAGRIEGNAPPESYPTATLGSGANWSERAFLPAPVNDEDMQGLGELRGKKPGQDRERTGAVSLASHTTRVRIVGNIARTEIDETFTNSTDEVLEGIYRFPLPPDAQIERLALDVDGKLVDGAFVDRNRAAAIWNGAIVNAGGKKPAGEEIVWVPGPWRDPALLEWQRGGRFELRIYPIPRRGSRHIVLAYTQVISSSGATRRYVYPLPRDPSGSTRVGHFDVDIQVRGNDPAAGVRSHGYALRQEPAPGGATSLSFSANGFTPNGDLSIEYSLPNPAQELTAWAYQPGPGEFAAPPQSGVGAAALPADLPGSGDLGGGAPYVAIALQPRLPRAEDRTFREFALVVDSSRSMFGERYLRASELASRVVRELDPDDRVTVLACDSTCRELPSHVVSPGDDAARAVSDFLRGITPEGGSDLGLAIKNGRDAIRDAPAGAARVIYIGDGTPTIGPVSAAFMRREVEAAVPRGAGTVSAVAIGSDADVATLRTMAQAGGGAVVPFVPGQAPLDVAYAVLGAAYGTTLADPSVALPDGLVAVAPMRLATIAAGGETMIVARMTRPNIDGTLTLRGTIAGAPFEQRYPLHVEATTAKGNAFVPRLWAAAELADLEDESDAASRARAVELSRRFHVASRYTSLMVLESAAMFRAFGLHQDEQPAVYTGDDDAVSTGADGETAVRDPEQQNLPEATAKKDEVGSTEAYAGDRDEKEAAGGGLASGSGAAMPKAAPASAAAEPAMRARASEAEDGALAHAYAPPPPAGAPLRRTDDRPMLMPPGDPSPLEPEVPERYWPRRYVPMRKIWERIGRIVTSTTLPASVTPEAIARAERDAAANALDRDAVKRLYTLYFLSGDVDRASHVAEEWSAKDPLDPDALTARADVAAARGERELAIRILGSVVDVRPGDHKAQWRLARLRRWAGQAALGCRNSLAIAQIRSTDARLLEEAVRCERDLGNADVASALTAAASDATRTAADALLAVPAPDASALLGDLRLQATWDGGDDLDLSLLPSDGNRVSWLGAPTKAIITARDVESTSREGLALQGGAPGDYVVEVTRPEGHTRTVRGSVDITAAGERRSVPFVLDGQRMRVALVKISAKSRLVPL